jgi:hypothetical protein
MEPMHNKPVVQLLLQQLSFPFGDANMGGLQASAIKFSQL